MAILYVFTINDPNNAGHYPPSIFNSDWSNKLGTYMSENNVSSIIQGTLTTNILQFADVTALNSWLSEYTLTDATLISDVNAWKSTHGVSYQSYYLDTANSTAITGPTS
jgi:hypothetical protein